VIAPGPGSSNRQEYHQKVELEQACLAEAGQRFTQAQDTPLLTPPLLDSFGKQGNPKEVSKVLAGIPSLLSNCDMYAAKFLSVVSHPSITVSESTQLHRIHTLYVQTYEFLRTPFSKSTTDHGKFGG